MSIATPAPNAPAPFTNEIIVKDILEAGVHFGHQKARWNPKMRPYIYGHRNGIHIIDLKETVRALLRAKKYLQKVASQGSLILFVGTKRQASGIVSEAAQSCGMPYITERWLGGTLTNFSTIRSRLRRLDELDHLETTGEINAFSKKAQSRIHRELAKMRRNLGGIRELNRMPEVIVMVDPTKEHNAVKEARLLGIKTVALIDTDSDPDLVDLPIPGNDDSMRSIAYIINHLAAAVTAGKSSIPQKEDTGKANEQYKPVPSI